MATAAERQLRVLNAKKESLFTILQCLFDLSKHLDEPLSLKKFVALYRSIDVTRNDLLGVIDDIAEKTIELDDDYTPDFAVLRTIDEICCYIHDAADNIKKSQSAVRDEGASTSAMRGGGEAERRRPNLPNVELPEFSGEPRQWEVFHSIFKSLVHDNSTLSSDDKVHYLVGRLRGPALGVCSGIAPTGENYEVIWNSLLDKYQDKRALANSYLDQIMNFKPLSCESAKNLTLFLEKFDSAVQALRQLQVDDLADFILLHEALAKLDSETAKLFDMSVRDKAVPSYDDLISFVKGQNKILSRNRKTVSGTKANYVHGAPTGYKSFLVNQNDNTGNRERKVICSFCHKNSHYVSRCEKFKRLSPVKRFETVRDNAWCYNCLSSAHGVRSCPSARSCLECGKRHHILLHLGRSILDKSKSEITETAKSADKNSQEVASGSNTCIEQEGIASLCSTMGHETGFGNTVILSTVVANIDNSPVKNQTVRFLLDSGSQANLLTVQCCKRLGIKISKSFSSLEGLGQTSFPVKGMVDLVITSRHNSAVKYFLKAQLVERITEKLPRYEIDIRTLPHLAGMPLADDSFYKPGEIEGIIGAELFPVLMGTKRLEGIRGAPIAIETTLGYVVMGKATGLVTSSVSNTFFTLTNEPPLEYLISKFWELDAVPKLPVSEPGDLECEKIYLETYSRDDTGRFTVALPFKKSPTNLGESKLHAVSRLLSLERKLGKLPELKLEYDKVLRDFLTQGHMRKVHSENLNISSFYIPHHAVIKPQSTSTPVRVVFDASAPCDNNISLNDLLYSGPKLQTDIFTLLINFRLFKVAITADIRQMYRQINIIDDHFRYQRLLWRFNPRDEIEVFELTTVAFGIKSSPFLALRTIKQLIMEDGQKFKLAAEVITRDLYMDDLVTSVSSVEQAYQLYEESLNLFAAGKFEITKWSTNEPHILSKIPADKRLCKNVVFQTDTKILGIQWNPELDIFSFNLEIPGCKCTKRIILSTVAKCFDPLGLIAPFILYLKLLVKELWQLKLGWDDQPPSHISDRWAEVCSEWSALAKLQIPRHTGAELGAEHTIVAFADASKNAYGSAVYLRTVTNTGNILVTLLCAKSKVAPIRYITIPRLELCAALLLSKLVKYVVDVYQPRIPLSKIYAFSDSTTVLQWLNSTYLKEVFVANRISQIRQNLTDVCWRHVDSSNNIADCISRGQLPLQLINNSLWFSGPPWLKLMEKYWPVVEISHANNLNTEECVLINSSETENHPLYDLVVRCFSWSMILRTTVWVLRFLKILPIRQFITASDLLKAELTLVRLVQLKYFKSELQLLEKGKQCSSHVRKLRPFLKDGLIRVGGRLSHALIGFNTQHPLLLPSKDPFVVRLVDYYHKRNLHTGAHLLEALIRQKYWLLGGRNLIRARVHSCNHCFRLKPQTLSPVMADLPPHRVQPTKAFTHTGLDYFGPVNITLGRKKGAQVHKAYVCLFICMSIKAVHMELVSSLSTAHFLQALRRFLSRRGPCKILYSDRGTNFIGARNVLSDLYKYLNSKSFNATLQTELAVQGIEWKFNPPSAPHMGGIWESNVKAAKTHIYRVLGDQILSYEEFGTLLTQVEALLNSRPLCRLSSDTSAPTALTPAHFLTLKPLDYLPAENVTDISVNRLDRFQLIDRMVQDFWKRWHLEYLTTLQIRCKWNKTSPNISIGTVVLLKTDNAPPLHWPLGIITAVHPGKDNVVRIVTVKTNKGSFMRPVVKVCPLPTQ